MDYNNIPKGLKLTTQIPLDVKTYVADEATLAYLGTGNNLAYTYYDGLRVFCIAERTMYEWREVKVGETNTGLITLDFTYPLGLTTFGINYSNKKYNFFKVRSVQGFKDSVSINIDSSSPDVSLEIKEIAENVGTEGITVYKEFDSGTKKHRFKKIKTTNLVITEVQGSINIDAPVDENNRSFFVDPRYDGTEKGTLSQPFKTLNKALDRFIDTGTWITPQNENYSITLLSSVELKKDTVAGIDGYTGRDNLDINNLKIIGNGHYLTLPANPSADYYPISTRRMVSNMLGTDINTKVLQRSVYMRFKDLTLQRVGTSAIVDNFNYSYPKVTAVSALSPLQPTVDVAFDNVVFTNDSTLDPIADTRWNIVPDPNGGNASFFGSPIYVSNQIGLPVPMLKTEGYSWNREGYLGITNISMVNSLGTYIYAKETSFSFGKIDMSRNQTRILYDSFTAGIYTPKTGQYYIELKDCNFTQFSTLGPRTIPSVAVSIGGDSEYIGGADAWLKMNNSSCIIHAADIEGAFNNIIKTDGLVNVNINNMLSQGSVSREAHGFHKIEAPSPGKLSDNISNSNIVDVKVIATPGDNSYLGEVRGSNNIINYYNHTNTGVAKYANNAAAITAGLFRGMEYENSSTGVLSRVY